MYKFQVKLNQLGSFWRKRIFWGMLSLFGIWYAFYAIPTKLFHTPYSTLLLDRNGKLLGASIATDGQWRFPEMDSVPVKFEKALLSFEDQYFYYHPGFNPAALLRALYLNLKNGRIVSGGSTITMQVVRLSARKERTVWEKILEILKATRLELKYSKSQILLLYASHAPFGGNVVGLEAASWRYFARPPETLSWAESALLAVLPNSPALIYPGKNHHQLIIKRNRLLDKLYHNGDIDSLTNVLAKQEPVPGLPQRLPSVAPHLLERAKREGQAGTRIASGIDGGMQSKANRLVQDYYRQYKYNGINNIGLVVIKVETGEALVYVGNTITDDHSGDQVDMIEAPRSTGSILKPLIYAAMLQEGQILPGTLVPDIPTYLDGFAPKNFNKSYDGAVPANVALAHSLNIPAVHMLQNYGYEKFHFLLNKLGLTTITRPPSNYGLSLILGGAEATLWDLTGVYAGMARTLNHFHTLAAPKRYQMHDYHPNSYLKKKMVTRTLKHGDLTNSIYNAGSLWFTFRAMLEVNRPEEEASWRAFASSRKIAWKTGTSYGFRDAWAIGVTPEYVVGVWVGNADGEGRPGLTGIQAAAPILFDMFDYLPPTSWFIKPVSVVHNIPLCKFSGERAGENCPEIEYGEIPEEGLHTPICHYCKTINLDVKGHFRVTSDCEEVGQIRQEKWFILPPVEEWYYRHKNPEYKRVPPFRKDCISVDPALPSMEFIYPKARSRIYVPLQLDGTMGKTVFEVAHRRPETLIYWHLDDQYLGSTRNLHQMALSPAEGWHKITLVDENGEVLEENFDIIGTKRQ